MNEALLGTNAMTTSALDALAHSLFNQQAKLRTLDVSLIESQPISNF